MFRIRPREETGRSGKQSARQRIAGRRRSGGRRKDKQRRQKAAGPKRGILRRLVVWSLVAVIWIGLGLGGLAAWYASDLPELGDIARMTRPPNITLVARDGSPIASFGGIYGESVGLAELPPDLPRAVLAIEDRRFYRHFGFDPLGVARALWRNFRAGYIVQGGSTVTQQLAKNLFLSPQRSMKRKFQELLLALWLEYKFSKDQILTIYLNRVYLGGGAYGVDAASRLYFGKPARAVSLYEAALLAGLLKAPSKLNPVRDAEAAETRAALVLNAMTQAGYISPAEKADALSRKAVARPRLKGRAPYFADWIMAQLRDYLGGIGGDLKVRTTLDVKLQLIAEEELAAALASGGKEKGASQAAFISLDKDGAVRAMVGGGDYGESQFNRTTQALRQPGSAFKAIVYLTALERLDLTPDSRMQDAPVDFAGWKPSNYGDKYFGEVTLRESFARSLNSVAVRLTQQVGPRQVVETARRLGITSDLAVNGSIALGTSEVTLIDLTAAYAAFANGGYGVWPFGIEEIQSASGEVFYRRRAGGGPGRVIAPQQVTDMIGLMANVVEWGTGKRAQPGRPAAGKTGTSQDFRDALFVGFTGDLVAAAWFGNDDNSPMRRVTGGNLPAALWGSVMTRAYEGLPASPLDPSRLAEAEEGGEGGSFIDRILFSLTGGDGSEEAPSADRIERFFQPREKR